MSHGRTITLGPVPLTLPNLLWCKELFDKEPIPLPTLLTVPKGQLTNSARLLMRAYGDVAIAIRLEYHTASMSWALVGPTLVVMALHPWTPAHQQFSR